MEPIGVHHLALKALDVQRTAQFYVDVLGLTETRRHVDDQGLRSIWLECGEAVIMIERSAAGADDRSAPDRPPSPPFEHDPPGLHLLALTIAPENRRAWTERLAEHGHPVVRQTDYTIYVRDPEGNRVGLSTWPDLSRPE